VIELKSVGMMHVRIIHAGTIHTVMMHAATIHVRTMRTMMIVEIETRAD
jgi:hypothetical protein